VLFSNPFPVQTFLNHFFEHRQGDKESRSDPYSADSTGVDPPVERGERDTAARAPAEKAPSVSGSEHGQGSRRLFGILPPEGWNWSSNGVRLHGETIPPTKVHRRQTTVKREGLHFPQRVHAFHQAASANMNWKRSSASRCRSLKRSSSGSVSGKPNLAWSRSKKEGCWDSKQSGSRDWRR